MRHRKRLLFIGIGVAILVLVCLAGSLIFLRDRERPIADPFTAKTLASVKFPLYYPTQLPNGFRIDPDSVASPQDGVIVFHLVDKRGRKIFISQEARLRTYNYGGFFKGIEDSQEFKAPQGQAITGYVHDHSTVIGSLVSTKTWLITNTQAQDVTTSDLKIIITSLARSQ